MPLGRNARQQRPRPPKYKGSAYVPRVDVFGTLKFPGAADARGRLIEYAPGSFAFFTVDSIESPSVFTVEGEFAMKGRTLTVQADVGEVRFQKAGCGCETPYQLRGARAPLLQYVPEAQPEPELTSDDLTEQLLDLPGASL